MSWKEEVERSLGVGDTSFSRIEKGFSQPVYLVEHGEGRYVVKLCERHPQKFYKEIAILKELSPRGLPVPRVVDSSSNEEGWLLMEFVEGDDSELGELPNGEAEKLILEMGRTLARIHKETGFKSSGDLSAGSEGLAVDSKDWPVFFRELNRRYVSNLEDTPFQHLTESVEKYFEDRQNLLPSKVDPVLVHKEYRRDNLIVQDGRVKAVLDWEWAFSGDPEYDLMTSEYFLENSDLDLDARQVFRQGYSDVRDIRAGEEMDRLRELYYLSALVWNASGFPFYSQGWSDEKKERSARHTESQIREFLD